MNTVFRGNLLGVMGMENKKIQLDREIREHEVIPVGNGYIDLITRKNFVKSFVNSVSELEIRITGFTW